jgi:chromosome segregation ATPase
VTATLVEAMPKIEIRNGKASGLVVELSGSMTTLGNRRSATVEIKDAWVSFNHAQITRQGDRFFVADMGSKSGTSVNGRRVDRSPVPIANGDRILLGKTEIAFVTDAAAEDGATPPVAAAAPESSERVARLERDLKLAEGDLKTLREQYVAREKALSDANVVIQKLERSSAAAGELKAARDEAARWKRACDDLTAKARIKIEELTRYGKQLEARVQGSAAGGAAGLTQEMLEKEREIARLREEVRKTQEDARARLADAAEKMLAHEADARLAQELEAERARAETADREAGIARSKLEEQESAQKQAARELKQLQAELKGYESALEERNRDVERLETALKQSGRGSMAAATAEPDLAMKAALAAETKRADAFQKQVLDLRTQVEEINQDMLEQEEELREEISELERKLAAAQGSQRGAGQA